MSLSAVAKSGARPENAVGHLRTGPLSMSPPLPEVAYLAIAEFCRPGRRIALPVPESYSSRRSESVFFAWAVAVATGALGWFPRQVYVGDAGEVVPSFSAA